MGSYFFEREEYLYKRMQKTREELAEFCSQRTTSAILKLEDYGIETNRFKIYHKDGFFMVTGLLYAKEPIAQHIALRATRRALRVQDSVFEDNDIKICFDELLPLYWHLKDIKIARGLSPEMLSIPYK